MLPIVKKKDYEEICNVFRNLCRMPTLVVGKGMLLQHFGLCSEFVQDDYY